MKNTYSDNDDKSAFNMGIATLKRIDALLMYVEQYRFNVDFKNWFKKLLSLRYELSPFMYKDKDMKEINDLIESLNRRIKSYELNTQVSNKKKLSDDLDKLEIILRNKLMEHDLLMLTKDDPSRALLG